MKATIYDKKSGHVRRCIEVPGKDSVLLNCQKGEGFLWGHWPDDSYRIDLSGGRASPVRLGAPEVPEVTAKEIDQIRLSLEQSPVGIEEGKFQADPLSLERLSLARFLSVESVVWRLADNSSVEMSIERLCCAYKEILGLLAERQQRGMAAAIEAKQCPRLSYAEARDRMTEVVLGAEHKGGR